jgi:hypothetical protein
MPEAVSIFNSSWHLQHGAGIKSILIKLKSVRLGRLLRIHVANFEGAIDGDCKRLRAETKIGGDNRWQGGAKTA